MPDRAEMHNAMMEFTGVQHTPSEQHNEVSSSRQARDVKDTKTVATFFLVHNPFMRDDKSLRNIANGVTASNRCNVDNAKELGYKL